jgi:methylamine dehydrogenase light chain
MERALEETARKLARRTSRRSFLSRLGTVLVGASAVPLLPVERASAQAREGAPDESGIEGDAGDPQSCGYWRHCAIDGFLSSCCGGSQNACPPGTEMAPLTWIGTCRNPVDGRDYIISYNDCCGQALCGRCVCQNDEGDRPVYITPRSNDINWCMGAKSQAYNSTVAIVLGVATE